MCYFQRSHTYISLSLSKLYRVGKVNISPFYGRNNWKQEKLNKLVIAIRNKPILAFHSGGSLETAYQEPNVQTYSLKGSGKSRLASHMST
jgi:hypothetical protein